MATWRICTLALAAALTASFASAQTGVYALFTGANLDVPQSIEATPVTSPPTFTNSTVTTRIYGPTLGIYANLPIPVVKLGADLRGYLLNGSGKQHYNGVIGPRIGINIPVVKLTPYAEFLFGVGSYKELSTDATQHIDYEYVVGVDRKLFAIVDWRVLEFSDCNYYNGTVPTKALATGLVVRIP
jgi:hypothetical protein